MKRKLKLCSDCQQRGIRTKQCPRCGSEALVHEPVFQKVWTKTKIKMR